MVESVEAEAIRAHPQQLLLRFLVTGDIPYLAFPAPGPPARRDGLWKHSCFEAFARLPDDEGYREFNFSPSKAWAAYGFAAYRNGMSNIEMDVPRVDVHLQAECVELRAALEIDLPDDATWQLNLNAVIEQTDGKRSFWALEHPEGEPDFHDRHCFVLELPPPSRP
jgi:hypothetical protein